MGINTMVNVHSEKDFEYLTRIMRGLESQHPGTQTWDESPFKWILALPAATKGAVGRQLVTSWGHTLGIFPQQITKDGQIYLDVNGAIVQVKFSTLWDSGYYRFQQIRDRDYDYCLCFGLAPFDMNAWLIPKKVLDTHVIGTKGQHTGTGSSETWWLEVSPATQEPWLEDFGGQLADVGLQLKSLAP
jgi:hypothetical protein